ncbi:MAG: OadG family protein [Spirochaetaceae bacterium]|nr:OadG family protein [Spirochaetaceae bacterium]
MTIPQMFEQSVFLAMLGMGIVFGFLAIMVISVTLTGKIVHAAGADKDSLGPAAPAQADTGAVTAVISAAVAEHRKNN